ncbi:MAG: hypothetical protein HFJ53_04595 [Clostridia bacterium]|jgi:hypothetical protein|nr:hypothetical protein [Clostridia bacterium]
MVLVFFISILIIIISIIILFTTISLNIKKVEISNYNIENKIKYNYEIYLDFKFLDRVKLLEICINERLLKKLKIKEKIKSTNMKQMKNNLQDKVRLKQIIQKLNMELYKIDLKVEIGTPDVIITSRNNSSSFDNNGNRVI